MIFLRPFDDDLNRRKKANRLDRATRDSEKQDDARINRWLQLAEEMFGRDDKEQEEADREQYHGDRRKPSTA